MKKCVKAYNLLPATYKNILYDAADSGMKDAILNELISYISEDDAKYICDILELISDDIEY